jgi:hypothetical protein
MTHDIMLEEHPVQFKLASLIMMTNDVPGYHHDDDDGQIMNELIYCRFGVRANWVSDETIPRKISLTHGFRRVLNILHKATTHSKP